MAIPYFFRPERIAGKWVVDGGMQNNYPVYSLLRFDPDLRDSADFLGLYLGHKNAQRSTEWFLLDLFTIWSESGDEEAMTQFIDRTVIIDPRPVRTTDFSLSQDDVKFLLAEGKASALRWLYHWGDDKRPALDVVTDAEKRSTELRTLAIAKRWRRFLPKFVLIIVILLVTAVYVAVRINW
jgi:predicted acylesterase/phospholipase RssA